MHCCLNLIGTNLKLNKDPDHWNGNIRQPYQPPCTRWGCTGKREIRDKKMAANRLFRVKIHQLQHARGNEGVLES